MILKKGAKMNAGTGSKKDNWTMNYMKFFGILYMLIYHSALKQLNVFAILFFVQMFIFISGYFYKDDYSSHPVRFLRRRLRTLYLPFVVYCTLFLVFNNLFVRLNLYPPGMWLSGHDLWRTFLSVLVLWSPMPFTGAMWFVSSLLIVSVLFCLISWLLRFVPAGHFENSRFFLVTLLCILGFYLSVRHIRIQPFVDISFVLMIFFYGGYMFRKYEAQIPVNIYLAVSSFLMLCLCLKYGYPAIIRRIYVNPPFLLFAGFAGVYLQLYISRTLARFAKIQVINYIGKNTLAILALHFLSFKAVHLVTIYTFDLPLTHLADFPIITSTTQAWRWLYVLAGLTIPVVLKSIFDLVYGRIRLRLSGLAFQRPAVGS